uniref:Transposase Tc1-like domain-containing protein n=1 Tax=Sinocyclocheilus anshuiensis TaxID=1608454 RepID=A0A671PR07_9TELE
MLVSQSVINRMQQRHREIGRVTERHRSGRPLATSHADDRFIVNTALQNRMMNATQLQAMFKGGERHLSVTSDHSKPLTSARRSARVPDHTTRLRHHRLAWAREHLRWTRNQWASVLFTDEGRFTLSRNYGRQCCWEMSRRTLCISHCCHQTNL